MSKPMTRLKWLKAQVGYASDDCLTWPFSTCNGYGTLGVNRKVQYAHRVMCQMVHGDPPTDKHHAAHSCGNGHLGCVNPRHMLWKTPSENQLDRALHGTKSNGARGKLTPEKAAAIRILSGKMLQKEIAEIFDISRSQVSWVVTGKSWREDRKRARPEPIQP